MLCGTFDCHCFSTNRQYIINIDQYVTVAVHDVFYPIVSTKLIYIIHMEYHFNVINRRVWLIFCLLLKFTRQTGMIQIRKKNRLVIRKMWSACLYYTAWYGLYFEQYVDGYISKQVLQTNCCWYRCHNGGILLDWALVRPSVLSCLIHNFFVNIHNLKTVWPKWQWMVYFCMFLIYL